MFIVKHWSHQSITFWAETDFIPVTQEVQIRIFEKFVFDKEISLSELIDLGPCYSVVADHPPIMKGSWWYKRNWQHIELPSGQGVNYLNLHIVGNEINIGWETRVRSVEDEPPGDIYLDLSNPKGYSSKEQTRITLAPVLVKYSVKILECDKSCKEYPTLLQRIQLEFTFWFNENSTFELSYESPKKGNAMEEVNKKLVGYGLDQLCPTDNPDAIRLEARDTSISQYVYFFRDDEYGCGFDFFLKSKEAKWNCQVDLIVEQQITREELQKLLEQGVRCSKEQ